jgi:uncharacterized lipoprotein YmbA
MTHRGLAYVAAVLGLSLSVGTSACGSSPDAVYFVLSPVPASHPPEATASWAHLVKVRRPAIAGYLDRAEIVSRVADYRLRVASGESWSEPFGDMIGRVLGEDLGERLRGSIVFSEASPISADPDAVVSVDIQRFDVGDDGDVTLRAEVAIERARDRATASVSNVDLKAHPRAAGTAALARAMSDLIGQLADRVALDLKGP